MTALGGLPDCIIQRGKAKSRMIAEAVIEGCGGGRISFCRPAADIDPEHTPVFIGVHPTTVEALHDVRAARRPFVTIDNGYFRPYKEGGYFRATSNAMQWAPRHLHYLGRKVGIIGGARRFAAHGLEVKPFQPRDGYVLVVLQSPDWLRMMREFPTWEQAITSSIRANTRREVIVRPKPLKLTPTQPPLAEHLAGAGAVVAFSSNVLIEAALEGIPVFPQAHCAAGALGTYSLRMIDDPLPPKDRERVFNDLAANQWTLEEIAAGDMWRALQDRFEPEFHPLA